MSATQHGALDGKSGEKQEGTLSHDSGPSVLYQYMRGLPRFGVWSRWTMLPQPAPAAL